MNRLCAFSIVSMSCLRCGDHIIELYSTITQEMLGQVGLCHVTQMHGEWHLHAGALWQS